VTQRGGVFLEKLTVSQLVKEFPQFMEPESSLPPRLLPPRRATCLAHLIPLYFITLIIFGEQYKSINSSLYSYLHSRIISFHLRPNILLNTLLSDTLILRSSLNVSDQVSHPFKTTDKITLRFILTWIVNWKTKDFAPNNNKHSYVFMVLIMPWIAILGIVKSSKFGSVYLRGDLTIPETRKEVSECDNFHF
jgi:hypothetical protein